jgi:lipopolysaccharide biosynthesis glycosyltransferase
MEKAIHISYGLDDNFAELTAVSMASILNNTERSIIFHVIENGLSEKNKNAMRDLRTRFQHGEWIFYRFKLPSNLDYRVENHLSVATYYKLFLPEILKKTDRVIHMDGDTVVEGNIGELWDIHLGEKTAGMAADISNRAFTVQKEIIGLALTDVYFNSGVVLMNLTEMRKLNIRQKLSVMPSLFSAFKEKNLNWLSDQEMLNHILKGKILLLPPRFNFQVLHTLYTAPCYDAPDAYELENWKDAYKRPVVIHFIGAQKPSKITRTHITGIHWEKYYTYKAMTSYADVASDNAKIRKYHRLLARADDTVLDASAFFKIKWYPLFTSLAKELPDWVGKKSSSFGVPEIVFAA